MASIEQSIQNLASLTKDYFKSTDFPCLLAQCDQYLITKPLAGVRVLHCSPMYRNTVLKIIPMVASGAELQFSLTRSGVHDSEIVRAIQGFGFTFYTEPQPATTIGEVDIVLDCSGSYSHLTPTKGAVELTKTGESYYEHRPFPVISVDRSPLKELETRFGTGEAYVRALQKLNIEISGTKFLVFGYGKIGQGVVQHLISENAVITIVELPQRVKEVSLSDIAMISSDDHNDVQMAIDDADIIVTCTGITGAIEKFSSQILKNKRVVLTNLGATDEYGDSIPECRVLNSKKPLNFILDDPTRIEFIDPIFAMHNACAGLLLQNSSYTNGLNSPPSWLNQQLFDLSKFKTIIVE